MIGYFLIVDFPDKATFLSPPELRVVRGRIDADRGDAAPDVLTTKVMFKHLCDVKLWLFGIIFCSGAVTGYAFSFFLAVSKWPQSIRLLSRPLMVQPQFSAAPVILRSSVSFFRHRRTFLL